MATASQKILIIEDEKPMARALQLKLTHAGYTAVTAGNGEEALELLQHDTFALMLVDLVMPKMDGFKFLENLQAQKILTPVIVLSNLSQIEDEKKARALGAVSFFIKSNTPLAQIVELVKEKLA